QQRMPPWLASARHGEFANRRGLDPVERRTIADWVAAGSARGDAAAEPPPLRFPESRWKIGEPDLVIRTAVPDRIPATGQVPYEYTVLPHLFAEDTWLQAIQILPDNPRVVHHVNLGYLNLGEKFDMNKNFVTGQVPGGVPMVLEPGVGFLVPKGSVLGLEIHYVTTGKEETNTISVGLVFPKQPVRKRVGHLTLYDMRFAIPPGAGAHPVRASRTLACNATGIGMFAHMHWRGRDMAFDAAYPDGRTARLLLIPRYSFHWQASYVWPTGARRFPKGTRIDCLAHFDNSRFNPFNPDPGATVTFGLQTDHEMMYGFFFYTDDDEDLSLEVDPKTGIAVRPRPG